jgi:hypothetical protein
MKKLLEHKLVFLSVVFAVVFVLLFTVIPLRHFRTADCVVQPGEDMLQKIGCNTTCEGYRTPDGLKPESDRVERYHLLLGQLDDYQDEDSQYAPSSADCTGGLEVTDVRLYL